MTAQAETVLDNFDSAVYTGNNGTQNWSTDWQEINEANGASSGDVEIVTDSGNTRLQVKDDDVGIEREANLSGATVATLSFVYRRQGLDSTNDYVAVEVSGDGGTSWTELDRFTGSATDASYQSASYNITAYIASNTQIRFVSSPSNWMRNWDIVYFDDVQIDYTVPSTPHFSISHDGVGDNCTVENITIAHHSGSTHTVDTTYTGTITLSTSTGTGDWSLVSGSGTLTNGGSGAGTYVFNVADNGQVILGLSDSTTANLNINITDGTYSEDGTEDADIAFSNTTSNTYADDFSVTSYSNSTGTLTWATDWLEIDEADGASSGDVRISNNSGDRRLRIKDNGSSSNGEGVQREMDISAATTAILTFDYRRTGLDNANDYVAVEVSADGGANWTQLDKLAGPTNDFSYQAANYNITAYKAANTRIRFLSSSSMGNWDVVYIDNVVITASTPNVCGGIDHFNIVVPAGANVCGGGSSEITITAEDSTNATVTSYVDQVNLTVSNNLGDWTSVTTSGTLNNGTADDGAATYQFVAGDSGTITLELGMSTTATVTVTVQDSGATVTTTSASFDFTSGTQSLQVDADAIQVAGRPQEMTVSRLNNDCTVNTGYNATPDMTAWVTRDVSDPNGTAPTINGISLPDTEPGSDNLTGANALTFVNGIANFNLDTTDIGKYTFGLKHNSREGASSTIITRPFGFDIDFSSNRKNNGIAGISYAADQNGSSFAKAGNTFSTTVTAMQWQLADDANDDGVPDTSANLTDNTATASFGGEGATVDLTSSIVAPAGGSNGTLYINSIAVGDEATSIVGFVSGARTLSLVWDEVGIIDINANITGNNYWSSGADVTGTVSNVGRFYPDHFALSGTSITNRSVLACGTTYTYMEEAFSTNFTLTAQNSANITTTNYTDVYAMLDVTTSTDLNFAAVNDPAGTLSILTSRLDLAGTPSGSWSNGVATISYPVAVFKDAPEDGPYALFNIGIAPADSDSVVLNTFDLDVDAPSGSDDHAAIGSNEIRFGRIVLSNAFGSELVDLNVPMVAQYYDGDGFINAGTDDICTTLATITITDVSLTDSLDATVDTCVLDTSNPGVSGSGCTTPPAVPASSQYQSPPDLLNSEGSFNLTLRAPGTGKTGEADITATVPSYMQYDWDNDTLHDNDPTARATFGIYKGKSETIFLREGR